MHAADDTMNVDRHPRSLCARMPPPAPTRPAPASARSHGPALCGAALRRWAIAALFCGLARPSSGQISLSTAVDLALRNSPGVLGAVDDVKRAQAQLSETHDVYIPSITAGAGIGQSYGYSPYPPTLFTVSSGSVVFSAAQTSYIRSARAGLNAAQLALRGVREQVAEETALAYVALDHDQQREQIIQQETGFASALVTIVQDRVDAGQDTRVGLTQAQLTAAQLHLAALRAGDETARDREHLGRLTGLPSSALRADSNLASPPMPADAKANAPAAGYANPSVAAAFSTADAKRLQARGDARFRFWPQINLVAQYNRYATFSDSFAQLQKLYTIDGRATLTADDGVFGVQISIPVFDKLRTAKARESAAEASHALHDAQAAQNEALDGQSKLRHGIDELQAQADVATLEQHLAQQQLDVIHLQMQSGNPDGPAMTPKDEQNAHIAERDKYLAVIDTGFQLRQAEIQLLRLTGDLESWLKSAAASPPPGPALQNSPPATTARQP